MGAMSDGPDERVDDAREIPLDTVFDLLAVQERRAMLYYLADHGTVPLDELAASVAERNADGEVRYRVATALTHVHLPRCVDAGVVTVDSEPGEAHYHPEQSFTAWLDWARERDTPTSLTEVDGGRGPSRPTPSPAE